MCISDLRALSRPRIGNDCDVTLQKLRTHIDAVLCARDKTAEAAEIAQDCRSARLKRNDAARGVWREHENNITNETRKQGTAPSDRLSEARDICRSS